MNGIQSFLMLHWTIHQESRQRLLSGLTDEDMRRRPNDGANSIAWLVWHMARCEDVGVNRLVAQRPPLLSEGDWSRGLGLSRLDIGTGMSDSEVTEFSKNIDLRGLLQYWTRVGQTTTDVVLSLRPDVLDELIDVAYLKTVVAHDSMFGDKAGEVLPFWEGRTKGWFLFQLGLRHSYVHLSEANRVRGLLGFS